MGTQLDDGVYFARTSWPADLAQPLELDVLRFEQCTVLQDAPTPYWSCLSRSEGDEYLADELGVDGSSSRQLTVTLDDSVRVVVVGFGEVRQGTGTDLAELATAVELAYAEVFVDQVVAGKDWQAILDDVLANPRAGFSVIDVYGSYEAIIFAPESGPQLLLQSVPHVFSDTDGPIGGRGVDVLAIQSIQIIDGHITLYFYAAEYP